MTLAPPEENHYLLVSDVDDTLLGDDTALEEFVAWRESLGNRLQLVYASGRFVDSVLESVANTLLPDPLAVIGGVGTEARCLRRNALFADWPVRDRAAWRPADVRACLADEADLEPQPDEFQSDFKISYFLHNASAARLESLVQRLAAIGIAADCIYSSQRDLDVAPVGVNKGSAAAHVAAAYGYRPEQVLVSGNSANDAALFRYGFRGIIVGNAHEELKALSGDRAYLARRGFAAGVQEGLQHWTARDGQPF